MQNATAISFIWKIVICGYIIEAKAPIPTNANALLNAKENQAEIPAIVPKPAPILRFMKK